MKYIYVYQKDKKNLVKKFYLSIGSSRKLSVKIIFRYQKFRTFNLVSIQKLIEE